MTFFIPVLVKVIFRSGRNSLAFHQNRRDNSFPPASAKSCRPRKKCFGILKRLSAYCVIYILLLTAGAVLVAKAQANDKLTPFNRLVYVDGSTEVYYAAGNEFLEAGVTLLDEWWSNFSLHQRAALRGHSDNFLPAELKLLNHKPADTLMRSFANDFFKARNPSTGLIPYSSDNPRSTCLCRTGGLQPVYLIERAAEFARWFPSDQNLQKMLTELADATIKYFDLYKDSGSEFGIWGWVDVRNGKPGAPIVLIQDFGALARAMSYVSIVTNDPHYRNWALEKTKFVWKKRLSEKLPVLAEQFTPGSPVLPDAPSFTSDSDILYYVRYLFDLYQITGELEYRNEAMAVTDLWFDNMWNPEFGHWLRKMNVDGKPAVDGIYGDGKYNTIKILIEAYRVTKNEKYLARFWETWKGLTKHRSDGLVPEALKAGEPVSSAGPDPQQTIFLSLLLDAYDVSKDKAFLVEAQGYARKILKAGKDVMRMEAGQAGQQFMRLALASQKIRRLEIELGAKGARLNIRRGETTIFSNKVPGEFAVVYLPEGTFDIDVESNNPLHVKDLKLEDHSRIQFSASGANIQKISIEPALPYNEKSGLPGNRAYQP